VGQSAPCGGALGMEAAAGGASNVGGYGAASTHAARSVRTPYDRPDAAAAAAAGAPAAGLLSGTGAAGCMGNFPEMFQQNGQAGEVEEYQQMIYAMQNAGALGLSGEPCQFFQKAGWCKFGDQCRYAHVGAPRQTEVCQFFQRSGWCKWGDACRHLHPGAPTAGSGGPPLVSQAPMCKFFPLPGGCRLGETCRFLHTGTPGMAEAGGSRAGAPEVCNFYARVGWCKFGDACKYIHTGAPAAERPGGVAASPDAGLGWAGAYGQQGAAAYPGLGGAATDFGLDYGLDAGTGPAPTTSDGNALASALAGFAKAIQSVAPAAGSY